MTLQIDRTMRGSGRTTQQITNAPVGAMFVWCNDRIEFAKELCEKLNRKDLKVVGPSIFDNGFARLRGFELSGLIVDHAAVEMIDRERLKNYYEAMIWATTRVGKGKK